MAAVALVVAFFFVLALVESHRPHEERLIHVANTQQTEEFKRRLIDEVPIGSPRAALWDYFESLGVQMNVRPRGRNHPPV